MFFQLLSTIQVNIVAKITQSANVCVIFHVKHKKSAIQCKFMQKLNTIFMWQTKKYRLEISAWYRMALLSLLFSIVIHVMFNVQTINCVQYSERCNSIIKVGCNHAMK